MRVFGSSLTIHKSPAPHHLQFQTIVTADQTMVSPDGQNLDNFYLARPGADEVQLDLFGDYKSNVALYPSFQEFSARTSRPFWRCGARTIHSFCRLVPRRSSATIDVPRQPCRARH
jgi:hypothetical protein